MSQMNLLINQWRKWLVIESQSEITIDPHNCRMFNQLEFIPNPKQDFLYDIDDKTIEDIKGWVQAVGYEKIATQLDKKECRFAFSTLTDKSNKPLLTFFANISIGKQQIVDSEMKEKDNISFRRAHTRFTYKVTGFEVMTKDFSINVIRLAELLNIDRSELERSELLSEDALRYFADLLNISLSDYESITKCITAFAEKLKQLTGSKFDNSIVGHIPTVPSTSIPINRDYDNIQKYLNDNPSRLESHGVMQELVNNVIHPTPLKTTIPSFFGAFPEAEVIETTEAGLIVNNEGDNHFALNREQALALSVPQDQALNPIQGPPGSGKTHMIRNLIASKIVSRVMELISDDKSSGKMVWITSHQNKVVANIVESLKPLEGKLGYEIFLPYGNLGKEKSLERSALNAIEKRMEQLRRQLLKTNVSNRVARKEEIKQRIIGAKSKIQKLVDLKKNELMMLYQSINLKEPFSLKRCIFESEDIALENGANMQSLLQHEESLQQKMLHCDKILNQNNNELMEIENRTKKLSLSIEDFDLSIRLANKLVAGLESTDHQLNKGLFSRVQSVLVKLGWKKPAIDSVAWSEEQLLLAGELDPEFMQEPYLIDIYELKEWSLLHKIKGKRVSIEENKSRVLDEQKVYLQKKIETENSKINTEQEREAIRRKINDAIKEISIRKQAWENYEKHATVIGCWIRDWYQDKEIIVIQEQLFLDALEYLQLNLLEHFVEYEQFIQAVIDGLKNHKTYTNPQQRRWLADLFPVGASTLHGFSSGWPSLFGEEIDTLIMDESGMISIHQAFPALYRSKQAFVVGDCRQIEPILTVSKPICKAYNDEFEQSLSKPLFRYYSPGYPDNSLLSMVQTAVSYEGQIDNRNLNGIRFFEHRRCQEPIMNFCNILYPEYQLICKTPVKKSLFYDHLLAFNVEGTSQYLRKNIQEIDAIENLIDRIVSEKKGDFPNIEKRIGIITPFREHANELVNRFGKRGIACGTLHTFQGDERDIIILSTVVCSSGQGSQYEWFKNNKQFLNVAISRAKNTFILVGNLSYLDSDTSSWISKLVTYIRERGLVGEIYSPIVWNSINKEMDQWRATGHVIHDLDHLIKFHTALDMAKTEVLIVSPWIRRQAVTPEIVEKFEAALERGVKIRIYYGYGTQNSFDPGDWEFIEELKQAFSSNNNFRLIPRNNEGNTHAKILTIDRKVLIIGSWNWLSHPYAKYLNKSLSFLIRQEASLWTEEEQAIQSVLSKFPERDLKHANQ